MYKYLLRHKFLFLLNIIFTVADSALNVAMAFVLKLIVDAASIGSVNDLKNSVIVFLLYTLMSIIVWITTKVLRANMLKKCLIELKNQIFSKIIYRNISLFNEENSAKNISLLTNDINILEQDYYNNLFDLFSNLVAFIIATVALIRLNLYVAIFVFIAELIPMSIPAVFGKSLSKYKDKYSDSIGMFTVKIKDILSGFEVVKGFNIEKRVFDDYGKANEGTELSKYRYNVFAGTIDSLATACGFMIFLGTLVITAYFVIKGRMTIGLMLGITQLMNNIVNPLVVLSSRLNRLKSVKLIEDKIYDILNKNDESIEGINKNSFDDRICFNNVSFSYDGEKNVLKDVNFVVEKGKKYAILGNSGGGKSTILKLLLRYYDSFSGDILIDGIDNRKIKAGDLYKLITIIHQNIYMFDSSIKDNITLFENYDDKDIKNAIEKSGLRDLINKLDDDINSSVGENGCNLSGGEKQRMAIARAIIKNTPILVIDEATSSLDNETSYNIENSILKMPDLTCIVVTHKLNEEILKKYDEIIVLKDGTLMEQGTFNELMENRGFFYNLYNISKK
ncbi:MAG TPA: ABC transporter ATP-binding protein [Clostridiales bacterium]|nr:ABC transporter ATP-binding protein [Clostridiales bacterium]